MTHGSASPGSRPGLSSTAPSWPDDLGEFRLAVREWCREHVPAQWRRNQTGVPEAEFVVFQKEWFQRLRGAGLAVPHWPREWGGGMPVAHQIVLYQELAARDAPRLVLAFVAIHHAASTLLVAGTDAQRRRHLPAILDGEIWVQGFSEPEAGSDLAALRTTARRQGEGYLVNGQKLWASGALHADWCLLLARTDPHAPKRRGISYFLLDMRGPGIDVRPIRQATGGAHFCEIFLDDVVVPAANLVGRVNEGWRVAQRTLGAERGTTMLELAERLGNAGFRWLVEACARTGPHGRRPLDDPRVADRLAALETEITGLRALCRDLVERHAVGAVGPADASIVKLHYSELLQRTMDFGVEIAGPAGHTVLAKPASGGWESGAWLLDFIGSWEWTIPGGTSEIQRTIIGERGLGLPREPVGD
ncbi:MULTISPECIES: acyl-CoA dehydrogenase family protein [Streptomyces]|uniref:acyl-CoA dehydrogenase family protein n=1 Tax=Streptomyces TaxID=1883 RepID=UPI0015EF6DCB|nr:acyl-CoA dehydrogenase family protein [Streptomyces sp. WAC00263]KAF5999402.1 acyl-CoA dehydrogenase [Streptomyces sp. WAC00263]